MANRITRIQEEHNSKNRIKDKIDYAAKFRNQEAPKKQYKDRKSLNKESREEIEM
jgi:hypothetical protein